jgi:hypothetical protein
VLNNARLHFLLWPERLLSAPRSRSQRFGFLSSWLWSSTRICCVEAKINEGFPLCTLTSSVIHSANIVVIYYQSRSSTCCLLHAGFFQANSSTLRTEVIYSSEMSVDIHQSTWCYIHRRQNSLNSYLLYGCRPSDIPMISIEAIWQHRFSCFACSISSSIWSHLWIPKSSSSWTSLYLRLTSVVKKEESSLDFYLILLTTFNRFMYLSSGC